ncbi:hypothetical protein NC99_12160 [Sunxiuqinia dokdonensis]|uniref:Uncharacterized protein n=1 Tax=Sunxiuqinia dokdonensis TaxID=1409788 RepID=A0A0L8VBY2_9BACT|nr:hypothetical protein NC99_12160 [Sunxiuqinia dokdonensis]
MKPDEQAGADQIRFIFWILNYFVLLASNRRNVFLYLIVLSGKSISVFNIIATNELCYTV